jgi:hypothetical protein
MNIHEYAELLLENEFYETRQGLSDLVKLIKCSKFQAVSVSWEFENRFFPIRKHAELSATQCLARYPPCQEVLTASC